MANEDSLLSVIDVLLKVLISFNLLKRDVCFERCFNFASKEMFQFAEKRTFRPFTWVIRDRGKLRFSYF